MPFNIELFCYFDYVFILLIYFCDTVCEKFFFVTCFRLIILSRNQILSVIRLQVSKFDFVLLGMKDKLEL